VPRFQSLRHLSFQLDCSEPGLLSVRMTKRSSGFSKPRDAGEPEQSKTTSSKTQTPTVEIHRPLHVRYVYPTMVNIPKDAHPASLSQPQKLPYEETRMTVTSSSPVTTGR
jgi:hypothetical protein